MQDGEEEALDQFVEEEMRLAESELLQPPPPPPTLRTDFTKTCRK